MTTLNSEKTKEFKGLPFWATILIPIVALIAILLVFVLANPAGFFSTNLPPVEDLIFERIRVTSSGFEATVVNNGPDPVTIAQVLVDEAYWNFSIDPVNTIPRLGRATVSIPYPWVETEPHEIILITNTGVTISGEVEVATLTPQPGLRELLLYGLIGVYVGIIPVALGMLWYPVLRRLDRKWMGAILALTVGLLVFLLVDTLLEALEIAREVPDVFQGISMVSFAALFTWLVLLAISSRRRKDTGTTGQSLYLAAMIALGIGLHNLGEGLSIGTAFSLGAVSLGSFLIIGFTLHNITEGIGIVAPLIPPKTGKEGQVPQRPGLLVFVGLALLAGAPAILGTWIGGFAFSPTLAALFLGVGVGAIWQVIVEVGGLLRKQAQSEGIPLASWPYVAGFFVGIAIMYLTAFLVKA
jgi:zinc transporter ZupT